MKRLRLGGRAAVTLLVLMAAAAAGAAEEPPAPPAGATNRTLTFPISSPGVEDAPVPGVPAPAATVVPDTAPSPPVESELVAGATISAEPITTSIALEPPPAPLTQPDQEVQRRLEAPSPEVLMERHGTVGFLIRNPEPRNFLEVINPFAPEDFGPQVRETYNRDPNLKPGATLPRNFVNDMTHEPTGLGLFHWEW